MVEKQAYYLGHFISVTGGQEAIILTAVKNKSFGGGHTEFQYWNICSALGSWAVMHFFNLELLAPP